MSGVVGQYTGLQKAAPTAPEHGSAPAKINLGLVVGPPLASGKHEVRTLFLRLALADDISVRRAQRVSVTGFPDTIVSRALAELAQAAEYTGGWKAHITKRIPVAAGLGGGSSDAATALRLANAQLEKPLASESLNGLARHVGADVPFFLRHGACVGQGDGSQLTPVRIADAFHVVVALPSGERKTSTADVYRRFDARDGAHGFADRARAFAAALESSTTFAGLAALPGNDLAQSPLSEELRSLGAFRAEVSGAGPCVYGLFATRHAAESAIEALAGRVEGSWLTEPRWYV